MIRAFSGSLLDDRSSLAEGCLGGFPVAGLNGFKHLLGEVLDLGSSCLVDQALLLILPVPFYSRFVCCQLIPSWFNIVRAC